MGVAISVTGIAQVKIQGGNDKLLQSACELFLGKTEKDIRRVALETLEGHQRAIMGCMTVEVGGNDIHTHIHTHVHTHTALEGHKRAIMVCMTVEVGDHEHD